MVVQGTMIDLDYYFLINKNKKKCFIATAAYGTPMAKEVEILRDFRDKYLISHLPGQILAYMYYRLSPPIARIIEKDETLRGITRVLLMPIIYSIKYSRIFFVFNGSVFSINCNKKNKKTLRIKKPFF
ncbi:MAG: hypothetical protein KatS3mg129_1808 [Leptospiraceae bacterium]|nr:MAG: hypothetical protein KatS3mg129_1808 [Leptospiraceae bacterium]